jgi:hypothetical protein
MNIGARASVHVFRNKLLRATKVNRNGDRIIHEQGSLECNIVMTSVAAACLHPGAGLTNL